MLIKGVVERFITHLCLLVGGAAMLVAAKDAVDAVEVAGVVGALGAVVVFVTGTAVVLFAWLLN